MSTPPSELPAALQTFLRDCAESKIQFDLVKDATQEVVNQAFDHLLAPIKPGLFLLEKKKRGQDNDVEMEEDPNKLRDEREILAQIEEIDEVEENRTREGYVIVNDHAMAIWEYLGNDWSKDIRTLHNIPPMEQPPYLLTELRPWQHSGVAKLRYLASSRFRGGILGDEQGLGKTLTVLTALADEINSHHDDGVYRGFNLIVTTKTCIPQWMDEVKYHLGPALAEKSFVLDDPEVTANELLDRRYEFVFCTYQFVQHRWRAYQDNLKLHAVVRAIGLDATRDRLPEQVRRSVNQRHVDALFSPVYREMKLPIKHLVIDEAQFVKNSATSTHKAIRSLYYSCVFLLSGTFLANKWYDLFGLVRLFPDHPFQTHKNFMRTFARQEINGGYYEPSASKRNRLIKFLQAFVVSRPATLLRLDGMQKTYCDFTLNGDEEAAVAYHTKRFIEVTKGIGKFPIRSGNARASKKHAEGIVHAIRAQQICSHPILLKVDTETVEDKLRAQDRRMMEQFKAEHAKLQNQELMSELLRSITREDSNGGHVANESHVDERSDDDDPDNPDDPEWLPDAGDQEDEQGLVEIPVADLETEQDLLRPTEDRLQWLARVRGMTDRDLLTPKVRVNLNLLNHIAGTWPNQKVVIFSRMLKYLDILDEAIRRDEELMERGAPLRFDGSLDTADRLQVRNIFANPQSNSPPPHYRRLRRCGYELDRRLQDHSVRALVELQRRSASLQSMLAHGPNERSSRLDPAWSQQLDRYGYSRHQRQEDRNQRGYHGLPPAHG